MVRIGGTGVLDAPAATQDDGGAVLDDRGLDDRGLDVRRPDDRTPDEREPDRPQPTTVHDGIGDAWTAPSWDEVVRTHSARVVHGRGLHRGRGDRSAVVEHCASVVLRRGEGVTHARTTDADHRAHPPVRST